MSVEAMLSLPSDIVAFCMLVTENTLTLFVAVLSTFKDIWSRPPS